MNPGGGADALRIFSLRYMQVLAEISVPQQQRPGIDWKQLSEDLLRGILEEIHQWEAQSRDASQNLRVLLSKLERTGEHMNAGQRKEWVHSCGLLLQMLLPPFRCALSQKRTPVCTCAEHNHQVTT